jgi:hypothetical protein
VAFLGLGMIGMVESETLRDGKASRGRHGPGWMPPPSAMPSAAIGGIENRLHWVLEVVFKEIGPV